MLETLTMRERLLAVLPPGEWRGGQRVVRDAFELGDGPWQPQLGAQARGCLRELEAEGLVERRDAPSGLRVLGADEWRACLPRVSAW